MKLFVDASKVVHYRALGILTGERFLTGQSEKLVIEFDAEVAADDGSVSVALKTAAEATVILAEATTFTLSAGKFTGWLDLNTDEAIAAAGSEVFLEVSWQSDGHDMASDYSQVRIDPRIVTGTEPSPASNVTWWSRVKAIFSVGSWFTIDDGTETIIPTIATQAESEAGAINTKLMTPLRTAQAIAELAAAGNAPIYDNGFLVFTDDTATQRKVACFDV